MQRPGVMVSIRLCPPVSAWITTRPGNSVRAAGTGKIAAGIGQLILHRRRQPAGRLAKSAEFER
jgi:hypothetical protein